MVMPARSDELVMSNEEMSAALEAPATADAAETVEPDDLGSDDEVPATWVDEDEGDQDELDPDSEPAARQKKGAPQVRDVKANGKVHKVDMSDQAAVDQLLSLGLGARQVFSERDQLRKSTKTMQTQLADAKKYQDLWQKLEASKNDHDGLYQKVFGKSFAEAAKAFVAEQQAYEQASPEERRYMDLRRQIEADRRKTDEDKVTREAEARKLEERQDQLDLRELKTQMTPEFMKYEFTSKVADEDVAAKMNKALWKLTVSDLKEQYGDLDEVPPGAIRKAFRETHDMLWSNHKQVAQKEVKQITETKKKTSKEQAQLASTRNYGSGKSLDALAKEKDPVKLWKKMFR